MNFENGNRQDINDDGCYEKIIAHAGKCYRSKTNSINLKVLKVLKDLEDFLKIETRTKKRKNKFSL
jgi:hypothetical protein